MYKGVALVFALFFSLSYFGEGGWCNYSLLEFNADSFHERIQSKVLTPESLILKTLDFIDENNTDEIIMCTQNDEFQKLYKRSIEKNEDQYFRNFAQSCKTIYEESEKQIESTTQAATHMLFEKIFQKYEQQSELSEAINSLLIRKDQKI